MLLCEARMLNTSVNVFIWVYSSLWLTCRWFMNQQMIFIADLIACSTCLGHHYANHQALESIIQVVAACGIWCLAFQVVCMVWNWGFMCPVRSNHLYNTLELLMMGIVVPETCWARNKMCNKKNPLLHLVGILFPHINDNARSKSHQIYESLILMILMNFAVLSDTKWQCGSESHVFLQAAWLAEHTYHAGRQTSKWVLSHAFMSECHK